MSRPAPKKGTHKTRDVEANQKYYLDIGKQLGMHDAR
jgi:hypothetical protein